MIRQPIASIVIPSCGVANSLLHITAEQTNCSSLRYCACLRVNDVAVCRSFASSIEVVGRGLVFFDSSSFSIDEQFFSDLLGFIAEASSHFNKAAA